MPPPNAIRDIAPQEQAGKISFAIIDSADTFVLRMKHECLNDGFAPTCLEVRRCAKIEVSRGWAVHDPLSSVRSNFRHRRVPPRAIPLSGQRVALAERIQGIWRGITHPRRMPVATGREQSLAPVTARNVEQA